MVRCSSRRLVVIFVLLSCALSLVAGAAPAQARENPPPSWLDALVHQLVRWEPASWLAGRKLPGDQAVASGKSPGRGPQKATTTNCYSPTSDPDGCPG
jgi:hypothetical protein